MLKYSKFAVFAFLGAIVTGTACAESTPSVNGVTIPQARFDLRMKAAAAQGQPDGPDLRTSIREDLINLEVLSQAASKKGLQKKSEVSQQMEIARQSILATALIQDYIKSHPISDEALKQEFEKINKQRGNKEYKVSHILLKTEDEAKAVVEQLKSGKFEDIAMEKSQDPGSSVKGGDLGWAVPANFVKPFSDAMVALSKGQTSSPVQSQFGWHVLRLEDVRDVTVPAFEEVKANIEQFMQQQLVKKAITELRAKATVK